MKQVEEYVDKVYRNINGNKKEIEELKSEMTNHLIEAVHDLKLEGKSEREAFQIAIERFGKENELRSIISHLFLTQKVFGKKLLTIGTTILLISLVIFCFFIYMGNKHLSDQAILAYEVGDFVSRGEISTSTEAEIDDLVEDIDYIAELKAYSGSNLESAYVFKREVGFLSTLFLNTYSYGTDTSFVILEVVDYRSFAIICLFFGMTSFTLLFIIWVIIHYYHKRRTNIL